jgi:SAM-dependent methyltransferase
MSGPDAIRTFDPDAIRVFEHAGWQQAAATYEASFATATRCFVPALLDAGEVKAGHVVLDVASGSGVVTAAAQARGAAARGVDFSPAMLGVARRRHPDVCFDEGDAESLPYQDGAFDRVVSNFGIHHVPRPIAALQEAYRVLRPRGGVAAFTIWASPEENIAWKLVFDAIQRHGDMAASDAPVPGGGFRTPADCEAALHHAGFSGIGHARLDAVWHHANAEALLAALRNGTARMAALIKAQSNAAMAAIVDDIEKSAAVYSQGDMLVIPIASYVTHGRRPA